MCLHFGAFASNGVCKWLAHCYTMLFVFYFDMTPQGEGCLNCLCIAGSLTFKHIVAYTLLCRLRSYRNSQSGVTALMAAIEEGHMECARLLLDAGADSNPANQVRMISLELKRVFNFK